MKEESKRWWEKAKSDLEKAEILFKNKKFDGSIFYCQQSVEKALKSLIIEKKNQIKKIHDLVELGSTIHLPKNLIEHCKELTQAYTYARYPDIKEPANINKISANF